MADELRRRVNELFYAALEREPETRLSFLESACGEDADLRHQVELLLSKQEEAGSFLEIPAIAYTAGTQMATVNSPTQQFGAYRIVSPLGAGGMGEVFRAHDSKLGRDVAVKFLPSEFARDPDRLARFRREARTLASLNHPHIGAIFGLEEHGELECLVLELVEGEVLRGPLAVTRALEYARQVAEALEAAHAKGIIHRDLKPSNIKVTPQGQVKVLDFGLAKAIWGPEQNPSFSPATGAERMTLAGHIVGTPGYMSPEQANGSGVDERTDIWAFGCLLYELLTGKRAFRGETISEEPNWQVLPATTPPKIRELLRQCLQRDRSRRLPNVAEARSRIEQVQHGMNRSRFVAVAATALAALALVAALTLQRPTQPPDRSRWVQLTKFPDPVSQPALSPDGRMLAFVRSPSTFFAAGQIYVKSMPDGEPAQLTHDNLKKMSPVFSPDGQRIAYTTVDPKFNWDTWVVPAGGGEPQPWLSNASGLIWIDTNRVLFSEIKAGAHMGIVAAGKSRTGAHDIYLPPTTRGMAHRSYPSPDRKWVLLAEMDRDWLPCRIVPSDGSSSGRQVGPPGPCVFGAWSPDGKWVYVTSKSGGLYHIWRQPFPDGHAEQVTSGLTEEEGIAMAPDGRSFVTAVALQNVSVWVHDAKGDRQISRLEGNASYPKFTPDGKRLCYRIVTEVPRFGTNRDPGEVWVADLESGHSEPVAPGFQPIDYDISPDGQQVVMEAPDGEGKPRFWLAPLDHRSPPHEIPNVEGRHAIYGPGGDIFFLRMEGSSGFVYAVKPNGTGLHKAFEQTALSLGPFTPDGRWVVAWAPLPGAQGSAVQLFPLGGGNPIVIGSNTALHWSRNGDSLWISGGVVPDGQTYIVPLRSSELLPPIPADGFHLAGEIARLPGAHRIDSGGAPGPSLDVYAFLRSTVQRNLYRIPIL
jgi:Tol biopolymer transport system component